MWSATQETDRIPSPLRVEALIWAFWCRPLRQLYLNPRHDRSRPHHNLHGIRTACVVYLLACFSHRNGFPGDLLMRSTSRRLAWENRRHRSWTPAMVRTSRGKKKAAGNAAHHEGDECVEGAGVPATPPSLTSLRCRGHRLRTAKKEGVFPKHPRVRRIAPSPKKQSNDDVRFSDWSSPSRQNKGCGQQSKKQTGFPRRYG